MKTLFVRVKRSANGERFLDITDADVGTLEIDTEETLIAARNISEVRFEVGESRFNLLLGKAKK